MKKIILMLLLSSFTAHADGDYKNNYTPENKYEINILVGRALNLEDFKLINNFYVAYYFGSMSVYRNFKKTQVGVGVDVEPYRYKKEKINQLTYFALHLLLNRTFELENFSLYAGVMGGLAKDNKKYSESFIDGINGTSWDIKGSGVVGGLQTGVLFKLNRYVALNAEIAGRVREMKYTTTTKHFGNIGPGVPRERTTVNSYSSFYLPFKLGIRVRI